MTTVDFGTAPSIGQQVDTARIVRYQIAPGFVHVPVNAEAVADLEALLRTTAREMFDGAEPNMWEFGATLCRLSRPVPDGFGVPSEKISEIVRKRATDVALAWSRMREAQP